MAGEEVPIGQTTAYRWELIHKRKETGVYAPVSMRVTNKIRNADRDQALPSLTDSRGGRRRCSAKQERSHHLHQPAKSMGQSLPVLFRDDKPHHPK